MPPCEGLAQKWAPAIQENCSREVPEQPTFYRSGVDPPVRVRWGGLMCEFRKGGTIWLRGQPSWGADSRKRQFGGRFSREKAVQSGGFLIECANLRMSSSESQTSAPLDETQKEHIVVEWNRRLEAGKNLFIRENFSKFRPTGGG